MPPPASSQSCAPAPAPAYRGRFAPSPTGDLHPGSLMAALGSWLLARGAGGEWLVRIEDLDPPREVPGAADRQLAALRAFGLHPDGPVVRQSERGDLYRRALDRLLADGHAFECHCSRADLAATGGIHRRCVATTRRPRPAVRLRVAPDARVAFEDLVRGPQVQDVGATVGDFVLLRADGYWAYQLAVVVDDAAQGITDVVRGADLLDSTGRQILLQRALGLPVTRHAHLPLVTGADGRKLSKSESARPVDPTDPLPALRRAWAALGQDPAALAGADRVTDLLPAARTAFRPQLIGRGDTAS
ncbi:glutamyl-Q tRNA(Asp) ligase [Lysobacter arseniciresistens ZS79]|uniref:Glutamyl-Q tRNA(Asp) synthetase n=1 Tax=Lysobacter arseniciresistens ZS79 TaxID=913325 RepID=A0A0A0EWK1_9GAMM|nr:tRNA glutamyl-Q(34) synthetase GluQRS [Lysobacter arseniciresistens]KGM55341.1 glutamyl-Q tRNA(Asp) ligase [Lysobacter arseniciresistens ZS79]